MITDLKDKAKLEQIAERIRTLLNQSIDWDGQTIQAGCSIGAALSGEDGEIYETLYKIADERMYEDKKHQRSNNRQRQFPEDGQPLSSS